MPGRPEAQGLVNVVDDEERDRQVQARFTEDVRNDPFMSNMRASNRLESRPPRQFGPRIRRDWNEYFGDGDLYRQQWAGYTMVLFPWLLFMWIILLWTILRHYLPMSTVVLTVFLGVFAFALFVFGRLGRKPGPLSIQALGVLCIVAVILGGVIGSLAGWDLVMRQYWWTSTGRYYKQVNANTDAAAHGDAALLDFRSGVTTTRNISEMEGNHTDGGSLVATFMSAGWRDGSIYCVAPILDSSMAAVGVIRVEYWAMGIDCCQDLGFFTCGSSTSYKGAQAVVMVDGGYPCPGCNNERFDKAKQKASAAYQLVSAPDALSVLWVESPNDVTNVMLAHCLIYVFLTLILSFLFFATVGFFAWRQGWLKDESFLSKGVRTIAPIGGDATGF